ncbi:MAG TPA: DUF4214 domain-containing protein, partial [Pyrinomonadaceae bacterium]
DRCDFTRARGTLRFAPGEAERSFVVLVNDDSYVEGTEQAVLVLNRPVGLEQLGPPHIATLEITDDPQESASNPTDDSGEFVRQHYHDFLNREPDAPGLAHWTNEIESCGADAPCREVKRVNVSAAFFLSIEFQETGFLAYRAYKAAFGDATSPGVAGTVPVIRLDEFITDAQRLGRDVQVGVGNWQQQLEDNKNAYAFEFVQRERFINAYPLTMTAEEFVAELSRNTGGALSPSERSALVASLGSTPEDPRKRAAVLRSVADDADMRAAEFNRAFVLMQYYGYLRRNPDEEPDLDFRGWKFWLDKLNEFGGNYVRAEMVNAFIKSDEYRNRFGR